MFIKRLATVLFILTSAALCFGQAAKSAPDLSGTWKLRKIDSTRVAPNANSSFIDMTLNITARASELKIERITAASSAQPVTEIFTFYSDGRGESNSALPLAFKPRSKSFPTNVISEPESFTSKTVWDKEKLVTRYDAAKTVYSSEVVYTSGRYEWKLSDDGKQLVMTNSSLAESNNPSNTGELFGNNYQRRTVKYVFERIN